MQDSNNVTTDIPRETTGKRPTPPVSGEWLNFWEFKIVKDIFDDYEDLDLKPEEIAVRDKVVRIIHYHELAYGRRQALRQQAVR